MRFRGIQYWRSRTLEEPSQDGTLPGLTEDDSNPLLSAAKILSRQINDRLLVSSIPEDIRNSPLTSDIEFESSCDHEAGIFFETLEEVCMALESYAVHGGKTLSEKAKLIVADHPNRKLHFAAATNVVRNIINRQIKDIKQGIIESDGEARFDFGSESLKAFIGVEVKKCGEFYSLRIISNILDDEPERDLSEMLARERALTGINITCNVAPVEGSTWAVINLRKMFRGIAGDEALNSLNLASNSTEQNEIRVKRNGYEFTVKFIIASSKNEFAQNITTNRHLYMNMSETESTELIIQIQAPNESPIIDEQQKAEAKALSLQLKQNLDDV